MYDFSFLFLSIALWGYVFGILSGVVWYRQDRIANVLTFGASALAGLFGLIGSVSFLGCGVQVPIILNLNIFSIPFFEFTFKVDPVGAFFVMVVSGLGMALSIFSLGYMREFFGKKSVGMVGMFFNLLLMATTLVFISSNAVSFLIAWEIMALSAFVLVSLEHEKNETRNAGVLYFVMSHIGTGCLILGFLLLFQAAGGKYSFDEFHFIGEKMSPGIRNLTFALFLVGFGVKAGIVPLHVWLPAAHPVAPSNVSALMSGVLIKTGIYGITRVCFDFMGAPPFWWGMVILGIGTVSALLGVLYALMEHDLKRLLAYHSIENIGIILMGIGASLTFLHANHPVLAALALIAGLYHTINHALFKGLLFLGAGAVLHSTHTRNMEELGGLVKRMPKTAFFFLIGAVAISALPPLNGFVSEWLTYQSLLYGFGTTSQLSRLVYPISGAMLALTGALAAACFVKAFGITFLAQPRSSEAANAHEASLTMLVGMGMLAIGCIFLGLFPTTFLRIFDPLTAQLIGHSISEQLSRTGGLAMAASVGESGTVSTLGMALMGICLLPIPLACWFLWGRKTSRRIGPTWDCGLRGLTPQMQYSATGFSKPLRMIFRGLFRPHRAVQTSYEFSPYFATTILFKSHIEETFEKRMYRPIRKLIWLASRRMRAVQAGSIQAYLIYILVTLIVLLIVTL